MVVPIADVRFDPARCCVTQRRSRERGSALIAADSRRAYTPRLSEEILSGFQDASVLSFLGPDDVNEERNEYENKALQSIPTSINVLFTAHIASDNPLSTFPD